MEKFQEADVLWPETPPPRRDSERSLPELHEAVFAGFSFEPFGSEPAAPSSTFPGGQGGGDASFQEADVLWPDDGYATREREVDGGELWWRLCCGFDDDAASGRPAEPARAGARRGAWRAPLVSSPIDIPTGVSAACRRRPTAVLVQRR